jgi:mannose-1-phosphate guanylyltransferase
MPSVSLLGVENLIVVQTADALLVADRNEADQIKKLVDRLPAELL